MSDYLDKEKKKEYDRIRYINKKEEIKERVKLYRKNNPEKKKEMDRLYRENNKEKIKKMFKNWYKNNREDVILTSKQWKSDNKDRLKILQNKYNKERRNNVFIRISDSISTQIRESLKGNKKGRHWETLVGYTISDLKQHLEKRFTENMSWDNYGRHGWNIDHIKPLCSFNYLNVNDCSFKECWSLNNLQPLWETTRVINGIKYTGNINKGIGEMK